jgi:hypothetical protein
VTDFYKTRNDKLKFFLKKKKSFFSRLPLDTSDKKESFHMGPMAPARQWRPRVDVMITIFCDFCQFSAKKWRFSQKPMF